MSLHSDKRSSSFASANCGLRFLVRLKLASLFLVLTAIQRWVETQPKWGKRHSDAGTKIPPQSVLFFFGFGKSNGRFSFQRLPDTRKHDNLSSTQNRLCLHLKLASSFLDLTAIQRLMVTQPKWGKRHSDAASHLPHTLRFLRRPSTVDRQPSFFN